MGRATFESPIEVVVRKTRVEVARHVRWIWRLTCGDFGSGNDSSAGLRRAMTEEVPSTSQRETETETETAPVKRRRSKSQDIILVRA